MRLLLTILTGVSTLLGGSFSHTLSMQGYTGIINTPNAQVMNEGDITFHFDNQFDNHLRGYNYDKKYSYQEDYIFGVGLLPYFEMQGRLSESPGYHRDLSANFKFQIPFQHEYLPTIALGYQDPGSAASFYENIYLVVDKEFWFVRASVGYGLSKSGSAKAERMDGIFGGVEVQTFDWLYLLGEYDTAETHAGFRLEMPRKWSSWFEVDALLTANLDDNFQESLAVNLTFPLYEDKTIPVRVEEKSKIESPASTSKRVEKTEKIVLTQPKSAALDSNIVLPSIMVDRTLSVEEIEKQLVEIGFENITIATDVKRLYISYENNIFLHNELDALGVVMGLAAQTSGSQVKFIIEPKKSKTVIASIRGDLNAARAYYKKRDAASQSDLSASLKNSAPFNIGNMDLKVDAVNDTIFKPRLEISPVVKSFVGTEVGVFDYILWLRGNLYFNLYKGIDFSIVADAEIAHSDDLNPNTGAFRYAYNDSHVESIMLHNSDNILGSINTLSVGSFKENYIGVMDQWIYTFENHTLKLKGGYFEEFKGGNAYYENWFGKDEDRKIYLAKYSYLIEDYDILAEIRGGRYWNQDQGFDLQLKRYFGDAAVMLFYQQSTGQSRFVSEQTDHYAGMGIEIPLTLKKTPSYQYGQVRGTNAFSYKIRTSILRDDGSNTIVVGGSDDPQMPFESENYFQNRNRMQIGYLKTHLSRLVNAYDEYALK